MRLPYGSLSAQRNCHTSGSRFRALIIRLPRCIPASCIAAAPRRNSYAMRHEIMTSGRGRSELLRGGNAQFSPLAAGSCRGRTRRAHCLQQQSAVLARTKIGYCLEGINSGGDANQDTITAGPAHDGYLGTPLRCGFPRPTSRGSTRRET
jgi:hypothetical protein